MLSALAIKLLFAGVCVSVLVAVTYGVVTVLLNKALQAMALLSNHTPQETRKKA